MAPTPSFGPEMRRRRIAAGLSLTEFANKVHYNKGYLSKVERGLAKPRPELVRDVDAALQAEGDLAALPIVVPGPRRNREARHREHTVPVHIERQLPMLDEPEQVAPYEQIFDNVRTLGQLVVTATVLESALNLYSTVARLAAAGGPQQARLAGLAARCAEYLGWLYQEQRRPDQAHHYTERARTAGASPDLVSYTWVRHAEISLAAGDPQATLRLAERAYHDPTAAPRVRGLAAHRIAQAHATGRRHRECRAALDNARRMFDLAEETTARAGELGTSNVRNIHMATDGWCDHELGLHERAIEKLSTTMTQIPGQAHRARAVFGARLSVAYAAAGESSLACVAGRAALTDVIWTGSGTARADLDTLARYLSRRNTAGEVRDLYLDLMNLAPVA